MRENSDMDHSLVIEDNTIYEIDLECYRCLQEKEQEISKDKSSLEHEQE